MASPFSQPVAGGGNANKPSQTQHPQGIVSSPFLSAASVNAKLTPSTPFGTSAPSMTNANPFGAPRSAPFGHLTGAKSNTIQSKSPFSTISSSLQQSSPSSFGNPFSAPGGPAAMQPTSSSGLDPPSESTNGMSKGQAPFSTQPDGLESRVFGRSNGTNRVNSQSLMSTSQSALGRQPSRHQSKGSKKKVAPFKSGPDSKKFAPPRQETPQLQHPQTSDYAKSIYAQLQKDGVRRPKWPRDPGASSQRVAMDDFMQKYKEYREKARKSLIKANLIDDPDKQKTLAEAIDFKGICENMCPEWEKIKRIVQHDVRNAEKNDVGVPNPDLMVKALARSAAGQEAPLPMDVLSISSCKRTVEYLFKEILQSDNNLPVMHGFLWDRTRAIRRDFVFHSSTSDEEKLQQIWCLETIVRFHVVALHLMAQKGFALEDYSEKQEIEQLSKSLLSLQDIYKRCRKDKRVVPPNEAEFVAYSILLYAQDPSALSRVYQWGKEMYDTSKEVRTAIAIVESIQNTWDPKGPEIGRPNDSLTPFTSSLAGYSMMFDMLSDPGVSYHLACFGEIHFGWVRQSMLKTIHSTYWRPRVSVRDFTVKKLKKMLRFDTEEEVVDFVEAHGVEFDTNEKGEKFMVLIQRGNIDMPKIPQAFSQNIVENKRGERQLMDILFQQVYEDPATKNTNSQAESDDESLFVNNTQSVAAGSSSVPSEYLEPVAPPVNPPVSPPAQAVSGGSALFQSKPPSFSTQILPQKEIQQKPFQDPFHSLNKPLSPQFPLTPIPPQQQKLLQDPFRLLGSPPSFLSQPTAIGTEQQSLVQPQPVNIQTKTATASPVPQLQSSVSVSSLQKLETPSPTMSKFSPESKEHQPESHRKLSEPQGQPPVSNGLSLVSNSQFSELKEQSLKSHERLLTTSDEPSINLLQSTFIPSSQSVISVDPFKGFTRWFVMGDGGLLDQFLEVEVERLVAEAFQHHQDELLEVKERKEAEENLALAKEFRHSKLMAKYANIWYQVASRRASKRRGKYHREKMQAWAEEILAKERVEKAVSDKKRKQKELENEASRPNRIDEFRRVVAKQRRDEDKLLEEALLSTGLLLGTKDIQGNARKVANDKSWDDSSVGSSPSKRQRTNGSLSGNGFSSALSHLRLSTPSVMRDDTISVASGISSVLDQPHRPKGKTARILQALKESKTPASGRFRRSLPPNTSLSRSLSSSSLRERSLQQEQKPNPLPAYWRAKLLGHKFMPNGQMLPERVVNDIESGQIYPYLYPSTKRRRSISTGVGDGDPEQERQERRRKQLERLQESDPATYDIVMGARQTTALLDDATELLRDRKSVV